MRGSYPLTLYISSLSISFSQYKTKSYAIVSLFDIFDYLCMFQLFYFGCCIEPVAWLSRPEVTGIPGLYTCIYNLLDPIMQCLIEVKLEAN